RRARARARADDALPAAARAPVAGRGRPGRPARPADPGGQAMIDTAAAVAHLDGERAERAVHAVLQTLAERLSAGEARDLAERLPEPLAGWLFTTGGSEPFGYDEFVHRVAAPAAAAPEPAARRAGAGFGALGRQVGSDEAAALAAELPQDFAPLVAEATGRF